MQGLDQDTQSQNSEPSLAMEQFRKLMEELQKTKNKAEPLKKVEEKNAKGT